jgi:hypothetical protein
LRALASCTRLRSLSLGAARSWELPPPEAPLASVTSLRVCFAASRQAAARHIFPSLLRLPNLRSLRVVGRMAGDAIPGRGLAAGGGGAGGAGGVGNGGGDQGAYLDDIAGLSELRELALGVPGVVRSSEHLRSLAGALPALKRLEAVGASEGVAVEHLGGAVGLELLRGALAARGVDFGVAQDGRLARLVLVGLSGLAYV